MQQVRKKMSNENGTIEKEKLTRGEILKQARESQGLGLDMVHDETKIPLDALKAIEEGYTIRTLSSFYRKSFTKIYANYLNIQLPQEEVVQKKETKKSSQKPVDEKIEVFDIRDWVAKFLTRQRKRQLLKLAGVVLALFVVFKFLSFIVHRKPKEKVKISNVQQSIPPEEKIETPPTQTVQRAREIAVVAPVVQPAGGQSSSVTPTEEVVERQVASVTKVARPVNLTVRASEKSWLRVKADGVVVFQTTLREGGVETWDAEKEIEISGRNLNKLEFELNGNLIGKLGRADRKAKKVVVTTDGLSVIK